jgi:hypothetical protein
VIRRRSCSARLPMACTSSPRARTRRCDSAAMT